MTYPKYEIEFNGNFYFCLVNGEECTDEWMVKNFGASIDIDVKENYTCVHDYIKKILIYYSDAPLQEIFGIKKERPAHLMLEKKELPDKDMKRFVKIELDDTEVPIYIRPLKQLKEDYPKFEEIKELWEAIHNENSRKK